MHKLCTCVQEAIGLLVLCRQCLVASIENWSNKLPVYRYVHLIFCIWASIFPRLGKIYLLLKEIKKYLVIHKDFLSKDKLILKRYTIIRHVGLKRRVLLLWLRHSIYYYFIFFGGGIGNFMTYLTKGGG